MHDIVIGGEFGSFSRFLLASIGRFGRLLDRDALGVVRIGFFVTTDIGGNLVNNGAWSLKAGNLGDVKSLISMNHRIDGSRVRMVVDPMTFPRVRNQGFAFSPAARGATEPPAEGGRA
jgi:hypothetical protein